MITDKYYTNYEMLQALEAATNKINRLTTKLERYTRGKNDCLALFVEYDTELRKEKSTAKDLIDFNWGSTEEFVVKLLKKGYDLPSYAKYCGYEIVKNKKPKLGDAAFDNGAMISNGSFWVSTDERNTGVINKKQQMFLETKATIIARPLRR
ncbi:hypothetical protein N9Z41_02585 [bacterium]|nr:hypothetical protein [bacterium]